MAEADQLKDRGRQVEAGEVTGEPGPVQSDSSEDNMFTEAMTHSAVGDRQPASK